MEDRIALVQGVSFSRLCNCLAGHADVTFTDRRRFFWSALDIRVEFLFRGHSFLIEALSLNREFVIFPKDLGAELPEMIVELRAHVAKLT